MKRLILQHFFRGFANFQNSLAKPPLARGRYSCNGVHGLVLWDELEPFLAVGGDLHLIAESHIVLNVLAGHADVVGDLVDPIALLGARQDAGASQAADGRRRRGRCPRSIF
jgi:hypothetical protein